MKYAIYISILTLPLLAHAADPTEPREFNKSSVCRLSGTAAICAVLNESEEKVIACRGYIKAVAQDGNEVSEAVQVSIGQNAFEYPSIVNTKSKAPLISAKTEITCFYREGTRN
jgi:hypothetical protein